MSSLGEDLTKEQARVRSLLAAYESAGKFGVVMIQKAINEADEAVISGDIAAMVRAYKNLKSFEK